MCKMPNITLSVSEELHKKMKGFSEIRWSEIARKAIEQRINDLETMERIASKIRNEVIRVKTNPTPLAARRRAIVFNDETV